jgi:hypothetical protein
MHVFIPTAIYIVFIEAMKKTDACDFVLCRHDIFLRKVKMETCGRESGKTGRESSPNEHLRK